MSRVHIIGAGLAGLAAAVKLIKQGYEVILYEAAPQAGGRCRSFYDTTLGHIIDNGNHLILGANSHALSYIDAIGSRDSFIHGSAPRYVLQDISTGKQQYITLSYAFHTYARLLLSRETDTVEECFNISSGLYRDFIYPFCIATLNSEPAFASASLLRGTLWQIIKNGRHGMDYFLPQESLTQSLIDPAIRLIESHHAIVHYNSAVKALEWQKNNVCTLRLADRNVALAKDRLIIATSAQVANLLLPEHVPVFEFNAIVNGHFLCPELLWPKGQDFIGVTGGMVQWLFYRNGILSTTSSAANALAAEANDKIALALWSDIQKLLNISLPLPAHKIICEKRATVSASPMRPVIPHQFGNVLLAGDYTERNLPCSIDSAVKSGFRAAEL